MAEAAALIAFQAAVSGFQPHITNLAINAFDKCGFDMDTTGRARETHMLVDQARIAFKHFGNINICVWNMHLSVDTHFNNMLVSGISRMGNGGGFRTVIFTGDGYIRNNGARGFENWNCYGNERQDNNLISFSPC